MSSYSLRAASTMSATLSETDPAYDRWQQLYVGMKSTEHKRLKNLHADTALDKAMLDTDRTKPYEITEKHCKYRATVR